MHKDKPSRFTAFPRFGCVNTGSERVREMFKHAACVKKKVLNKKDKANTGYRLEA